MKKKCAVLLSGGQDSTTCLYWAKQQFEVAIGVGFYYGQKHKVELECAAETAARNNVEYRVFDVSKMLSGSSLINHTADHNAAHPRNEKLPASFTAGRNALFLTIAASHCFELGITDLVTGVCQTDYSGYPDCRRDFINSMEISLSYAMDPDYKWDAPNEKVFHIHTPLMYLTKAETWKMAKYLDCLDVIINNTVTDYNGNLTKNEWGYGIDNNPATNLRVKGYYEAKAKGWI